MSKLIKGPGVASIQPRTPKSHAARYRVPLHGIIDAVRNRLSPTVHKLNCKLHPNSARKSATCPNAANTSLKLQLRTPRPSTRTELHPMREIKFIQGTMQQTVNTPQTDSVSHAYQGRAIAASNRSDPAESTGDRPACVAPCHIEKNTLSASASPQRIEIAQAIRIGTLRNFPN